VSDVAIRAALEVRLAAQLPAIDTAYENATYSPSAATPYQRVELMRAQPENPTYDAFKRKKGVLQVTLMYPQAAGPGAAEARADALGLWFPRGLTLTSGGIVVVIDGTPYVMAGFQDGDRWSVPVRIPYFSNISF
jgi:hypothetical protein